MRFTGQLSKYGRLIGSGFFGMFVQLAAIYPIFNVCVAGQEVGSISPTGECKSGCSTMGLAILRAWVFEQSTILNIKIMCLCIRYNNLNCQ